MITLTFSFFYLSRESTAQSTAAEHTNSHDLIWVQLALITESNLIAGFQSTKAMLPEASGSQPQHLDSEKASMTLLLVVCCSASWDRRAAWPHEHTEPCLCPPSVLCDWRKSPGQLKAGAGVTGHFSFSFLIIQFGPLCLFKVGITLAIIQMGIKWRTVPTQLLTHNK